MSAPIGNGAVESPALNGNDALDSLPSISNGAMASPAPTEKSAVAALVSNGSGTGDSPILSGKGAIESPALSYKCTAASLVPNEHGAVDSPVPNGNSISTPHGLNGKDAVESSLPNDNGAAESLTPSVNGTVASLLVSNTNGADGSPSAIGNGAVDSPALNGNDAIDSPAPSVNGTAASLLTPNTNGAVDSPALNGNDTVDSPALNGNGTAASINPDNDGTEASPAPNCDGVGVSPAIAVVGGGIAGLALAIALEHNGVPFHLYEAAAAFAEIGAGVALNPCAVDAMRRIDPALHAAYTRHATGNTAENADVWFEFRRATASAAHDAGSLIGTLRGETAGQSALHRAHLLDEMVALVPPGRVTFGKRVVAVADRGAQVELSFADGTAAVHAAAIGCDGIKSHVRDSLVGPAYAARFTGKYAYRGVVPMAQAEAMLGPHLACNSQMHCGPHGHVLTLPIARGAMMNVVAFRSRDSWPDKNWVAPATREEMQADFTGWGESVQKIIGAVQDPDLWALFDQPPAPVLARGRVAIMGDAAHASTPHQGSGAGMALEDAFILSSLLGKAERGGDLVQDVFAVYDETRRARSQRLVTTSRECGQLWDLENPDVRDDSHKFEENITRRFRWIWNHDLGKELDYAMQLLEERSTAI